MSPRRFLGEVPKPHHRKADWLYLMTKGKFMSLDENERRELDALWGKADTTQESVTKLEIQTALLSDRLERMGNEMHQSNGRTEKLLDTILAQIATLSDKVLHMAATSNTKGHLIDRWIPIAIAATAVFVAYARTP